MNFTIIRIVDNGIFEKERVVLKAVTNVDIGSYLLTQTGMNNNKGITNKIHNTYWFPDNEIEAGDLVVLYTKPGKRSIKENQENKSYFFYWGQATPVWNTTDRTAVLMEVNSWARLEESDETTE